MTNSRIGQAAGKWPLFFGGTGLFLAWLVVACLLLFAHQTRADNHVAGADSQGELDEVQQEWSEAIESLKGYSADQRDVAIEKAGAALEEMDERIEALQQRTVDEWESLSEETREARLAALQELVKQREELAEWFGGMKYSSAQAWDEVRGGFVDAYDVLRDAWDDAAEEFE